ncbi:MAG: hypothetical protein QOG43_708 [Actinomycetota bacterium]|jgi:hypothetical protein|nr:hypothetical protein [Actinomycetota bacterium]
MTGNGAGRVVIRQPLVLRFYVVAFFIFWSSFLVRFLLDAFCPIPVLMLAFGVTVAYRTVHLGVTADERGLLVRNTARTRRLERSEIEDFRIGDAPMGIGRGQAVHVLLGNGSVMALDVTMRPWLLRRGRAKLEGHLAALRSWLAPGNG